jgi:hypothetical protein
VKERNHPRRAVKFIYESTRPGEQLSQADPRISPQFSRRRASCIKNSFLVAPNSASSSRHRSRRKTHRATLKKIRGASRKKNFATTLRRQKFSRKKKCISTHANSSSRKLRTSILRSSHHLRMLVAMLQHQCGTVASTVKLTARGSVSRLSFLALRLPPDDCTCHVGDAGCAGRRENSPAVAIEHKIAGYPQLCTAIPCAEANALHTVSCSSTLERLSKSRSRAPAPETTRAPFKLTTPRVAPSGH